MRIHSLDQRRTRQAARLLRGTLFAMIVLAQPLAAGPLYAQAGGEALFMLAGRQFEAGDHKMAAETLRKAASLGYPAALMPLAAMHRAGTGVQQDPVLAFNLFKQAAESGYPAAQFTVAAMYRAGEGTQTDYKRAVYWYYKAAAQGDPDAQNNLGSMLEYGRGVKLSEVMAQVWYTLAARQESIQGMVNKKRMARRLDVQQTRKAERIVMRCLASDYKNCTEDS